MAAPIDQDVLGRAEVGFDFETRIAPIVLAAFAVMFVIPAAIIEEADDTEAIVAATTQRLTKLPGILAAAINDDLARQLALTQPMTFDGEAHDAHHGHAEQGKGEPQRDPDARIVTRNMKEEC